jgi:nicotinamidase/pyrazinamidase
MTHKTLIIVDLQNDFIVGGALAVPHGEEVTSIANKLQSHFDLVIATQDWHPKNHMSFRTLWPIHCVQHSKGAELVADLHKEKINKIIYKGTNIEIDSYSAFYDNEHQQKTEMDDYLKSKNIKEIYILGLATDYCVKYSVLDAISLGYKVYVIEDACRGININPNDIQNALDEMKKAGAIIVQSSHVLQDK